MQEQVSKKPLVDILSEMMGSQVVMRADEYVYLENKIVVSQSEIDEAVVMQDELYKKATLAKTKIEIDTQIQVMTVVTSSGKEFDADLQSRVNMSTSIEYAKDNAINEVTWRLADNSEAVVTLAELQEASVLSLQKFAQLKGIVQ